MFDSGRRGFIKGLTTLSAAAAAKCGMSMMPMKAESSANTPLRHAVKKPHLTNATKYHKMSQCNLGGEGRWR